MESAGFRFGEFRLDVVREELVGPAGACVLRRKVFDTLRVLLEAAPAVVTLDGEGRVTLRFTNYRNDNLGVTIRARKR